MKTANWNKVKLTWNKFSEVPTNSKEGWKMRTLKLLHCNCGLLVEMEKRDVLFPWTVWPEQLNSSSTVKPHYNEPPRDQEERSLKRGFCYKRVRQFFCIINNVKKKLVPDVQIVKSGGCYNEVVLYIYTGPADGRVTNNMLQIILQIPWNNIVYLIQLSIQLWAQHAANMWVLRW